MTRKTIATNQAAVACDVCGRTLLRGEHADVFLHGGQRRNVCELCGPRAAHEGWIREGLADDLPVRQRGRERRGGSWLGRLRQRRAPGSAEPLRRGPVDAAQEPLDAPGPPEPGAEQPVYVSDVIPEVPAPPPPPAAPAPERREQRSIHAVPTNADMKRARAVELFNLSEHPRTVAGIARSLGPPFIVVRPSETEGSIVTIVAGWELTWYRYEVDLADEAAGVRVTAQGDEVTELDDADQQPNAAADERGEIALVTE